jgi:thiol-disulfide isomerase/thioredoxin
MILQPLFRGLLLLSAIFFVHAEIVDLTDATFEHQTQASTGSTTGSWLVMFRAPLCQSCSQIRSDMEALSQDPELYERGIVLGSVDAIESPQTTVRFQITNAPTVVFIHKKQVYRLQDGEDLSQESLKSFVLGDYAQRRATPVPGIPSALDKFLEGLVSLKKTLKEEGGSATIAILGVAILTLVGVLVALVVTLAGAGKKNKKE